MIVPWRRCRRQCAAVTALLALSFIAGIGLISGPERGPSPGCQRILRLSSSLLGCVDRHPHPGACRSGSMDAAAVTACLRRRAARLRRPARLVLVGDSRARILQQQLSAFLQLANGSEPVDVRAEDVPEGPLRRHQLSTTRDLCRKFDKFCSHLVGNDLLQVDFWRRPYLHTLFTGKLRSLVAECRAGADGCPDLVVLNGGMWYLRAFDAIRDVINTPMTGAMMMRDHVGALREVLTELVSHTTVVWRLEEAVITDALPLDRKDTVQRKLTMSHALFFDLQRQVPGLLVWSSMLPETFDFAQRVCRPVKQIANSTDIVVEEIFDECDDEIHVGPEMRQRFVSKLLDILCETDGDRELGHCCRG
ncbi:uncharacterized protein LOC122389121 [Amphibalanus amphitrite]|uniref:uncharacterized protein LOC122368330 n=1 Tax=Amphibalanus amphitrite TaxID=1232801 RepID=UPI001C90D549|nr:uncharacterized protein LOC122368330 [Amphibalanus amphitrite]XP_043236756.1 uncharacterized protein LOC122389121 [Amphibalanus amphitrite]